MDMYQKRKVRAEKKKNNAQESATTVSLNCEEQANAKPGSKH